MIRIIPTVIAALALAGCADMSKAYSDFACLSATTSLGMNAFYAVLMGACAWIAAYRGAIAWALGWSTFAGYLSGHGYATKVQCGVGVFNTETAVMAAGVAASPACVLMLILLRQHFDTWQDQRMRKHAQKAAVRANEKAADESKRAAAAEALQFQAMTSEMTSEREAQVLATARRHLLGHLDTIEAAVRALKSASDSTVLINAIAQELGSIDGNERITAAMCAEAGVTTRVSTTLDVLASQGHLDPMLNLRFGQVFGAVNGDSRPAPAPNLQLVVSR